MTCRKQNSQQGARKKTSGGERDRKVSRGLVVVVDLLFLTTAPLSRLMAEEENVVGDDTNVQLAND